MCTRSTVVNLESCNSRKLARSYHFLNFSVLGCWQSRLPRLHVSHVAAQSHYHLVHEVVFHDWGRGWSSQRITFFFFLDSRCKGLSLPALYYGCTVYLVMCNYSRVVIGIHVLVQIYRFMKTIQKVWLWWDIKAKQMDWSASRSWMAAR